MSREPLNQSDFRQSMDQDVKRAFNGLKILALKFRAQEVTLKPINYVCNQPRDILTPLHKVRKPLVKFSMLEHVRIFREEGIVEDTIQELQDVRKARLDAECQKCSMLR